MGDIVIILLAVAVVKFVVCSVIVWMTFRKDLIRMWQGEPPQETPSCVYCQSKWTSPVGEGETRWEEDGLVLVTTYECQHCHLPFWHVERVPMGAVKHRG